MTKPETGEAPNSGAQDDGRGAHSEVLLGFVLKP